MPKHQGIELKIKRIRARLKQEELASFMGVTRVRIGQIEAMQEMTPVVKERYLTGLTRGRLAARKAAKERREVA